VDEGQDFDAEWLASLNELLLGGKDDVLYVFHDPAQAIFRDDVVAQLGLTEYPLDMNCRNTQPIHAVVSRFAEGGLASDAMRSGGRVPELIEAASGAETVEALRQVLHRLRATDVEAVNPWDIAVLTAAKLEESAVWLAPGRRYGNEVLGNPAYDDAGHHLGLSAALAPVLPDDVILCETIRRFKGLEKPVIVLVELREDDQRLERMLYVGASRARQHLVVIAPAAMLARLR
jgi:superfamily I DNA/RNA helicase